MVGPYQGAAQGKDLMRLKMCSALEHNLAATTHDILVIRVQGRKGDNKDKC